MTALFDCTVDVDFGQSQSGRYIRTFINLGFNQGEDGKIVFDGAFPEIGGGLLPLNVRWGQPGRGAGSAEVDNQTPGGEFPFTYESETDPLTGRFLNRNYSGYLVPTNADVPELEVLFLGEFDEEASPLGAKGLGELTAVSVAPAIANAVYHATGKRIRDLPITIEKLF